MPIVIQFILYTVVLMKLLTYIGMPYQHSCMTQVFINELNLLFFCVIGFYYFGSILFVYNIVELDHNTSTFREFSCFHAVMSFLLAFD